MLCVLDTTVLIDFLRGRPAVARVEELVARGITPATTAINVEEIVRGLREPERAASDQLFAGLVVLPVTEHEGRLAGEWRREHAREGRTLAQADCLIAATCRLSGAPLATGNPSDFPMPGVDVLHWPVGS